MLWKNIPRAIKLNGATIDAIRSNPLFINIGKTIYNFKLNIFTIIPTITPIISGYDRTFFILLHIIVVNLALVEAISNNKYAVVVMHMFPANEIKKANLFTNIGSYIPDKHGIPAITLL